VLRAPPTSQRDARIELWQQARSWYERSLSIYVDLEHGNLLTDEFHRTKPAAIKLEIARCDAALTGAS